MEKYDVNKKIERFKSGVDALENALNPLSLSKEYDELSKAMLEPNFWSDTNKAKEISKRAGVINNNLESFNKLKTDLNDLMDWFELSEEQTESWEILETDIVKFEANLSEFELLILLNGPYDELNAILEIHAGSGGTEAQDWGEMLYRMYLRYAQKNNFKVEVLDYQDGDEAGIKSVTILIKGSYAYGYLKSEHGVHRLVRISPFDSNARRHTSFASVGIMPQFDHEIDIEVKDEDIKVDVYRSSGAGGQSVNTTDSAVRITHIPTGIVVTCQNERSQIKNKETAFNLLKAKLFQEEVKKQAATLKDIKGEQKDNAWGSQIRSYVFHPYQMVKDHRTNFEVAQVDLVMDGEIGEFLNAYLKGSKNNE